MFEFALNHIFGLMIVFGSIHALDQISKYKGKRAPGRVPFKRAKNMAWLSMIFVVSFSYLGSLSHILDDSNLILTALPTAEARDSTFRGATCERSIFPGVDLKNWSRK